MNMNLKIIIIGSSFIGKTSLIKKFVNHENLENSKPTGIIINIILWVLYIFSSDIGYNLSMHLF